VRKYLQDLIDRMLLRMKKKMKGTLNEPKMKLLRKNEKNGEKSSCCCVTMPKPSIHDLDIL
jgi:hypothetical protein